MEHVLGPERIVEYEPLFEKLTRIRDFSAETTSRVVQREIDATDSTFWRRWDEEFTDIAYDHTLCRMMGVRDYDTLPEEDAEKIGLAALYLLGKIDLNTIHKKTEKKENSELNEDNSTSDVEEAESN